jgi:hypothetical protein
MPPDSFVNPKCAQTKPLAAVRSWKPILSGDLAVSATAAVEAIAADLAAMESLIRPFGPDAEFSLAHGTAGSALFFAYLHLAMPGRGYGERARAFLEQAIEVAATRPGPPCLFDGLGGVAWVRKHLRSRLCTDWDGEGEALPGVAPAVVAEGGDWDREAVAFMRRDAEGALRVSGTDEAGLCRGAAGNGHRLNRLAQAMGEEAFADTARAWFHRTLEMRRPGEGIGGFLTRVRGRQGQGVWTDDSGFLSGSSGIGLALLAAISPVEPAWDRLLLAGGPDTAP